MGLWGPRGDHTAVDVQRFADDNGGLCYASPPEKLLIAPVVLAQSKWSGAGTYALADAVSPIVKPGT